MLNLPRQWQINPRIYENDDYSLIFKLGRFKLFESSSEPLLILLDTKSHQSWGCFCFNKAKQLNSLKNAINQFIYKGQS